MSEDTEIDPEVLRTEVDQIKDAMGLKERYPSQFQFWLVFGVLVLLASMGSQLIALQDLSPILHSVVWFGLLGVGNVYQLRGNRGTGDDSPSTGTKPRIGLLYLAVFSFLAVVSFTIFPELGGLTDAELEILVFSQFIGLTGVGYLVVGEALRAYYIRRRDRWAFYIGGLWMLVLAALLPNVEVLHTWGYATFGIVFAVHAAASYLALR
jgi:hypothetical protein